MKRLCAMLAAGILLVCLPVRAKAQELDIPAKSALLMDVETGTILYEQNAHQALPPASVTKVMTMLLIMEAIDSGSLAYTDTVTASETAAAKGGSQIYLKAGEQMCLADMLKSVAVSSANDCACALAEHLAGSEQAFVAKMNDRARELGMQDTNFVNCTGLDDSREAANHRTSAHDIAIMSRELLKNHPDITKYTTIWMDTVRNGAFGLSNTNKLIRFYPGATGLKTGYTSQAGYCLSASAQRDGLALIAVVMGCESSKQRTAACKQLLDYGFANYALIAPELPEAQTVPVRLGKASAVSVIPGENARILVPKAQRSGISQHIQLEPEIMAPVPAGTRLGTLTIQNGDTILAQQPLVAAETIPRLTLADLYEQILRRIAMAKV